MNNLVGYVMVHEAREVFVHVCFFGTLLLDMVGHVGTSLLGLLLKANKKEQEPQEIRDVNSDGRVKTNMNIRYKSTMI